VVKKPSVSALMAGLRCELVVNNVSFRMVVKIRFIHILLHLSTDVIRFNHSVGISRPL
jgi:hypothetical protein